MTIERAAVVRARIEPRYKLRIEQSFNHQLQVIENLIDDASRLERMFFVYDTSGLDKEVIFRVREMLAGLGYRVDEKTPSVFVIRFDKAK